MVSVVSEDPVRLDLRRSGGPENGERMPSRPARSRHALLRLSRDRRQRCVPKYLGASDETGESRVAGEGQPGGKPGEKRFGDHRGEVKLSRLFVSIDPPQSV